MALLTTFLELLGLAVIAVGVGLVYVPAAVVVAGVELVLLGWLLGRPAVGPAPELGQADPADGVQ